MTTLAGRIEERVRGCTVAVVGVGNRLRGDDGAGSHVAERLARTDHANVFDAETTPEDCVGPLLELAPGVVLFVDAVELGGAPGACALLPLEQVVPRPASTHAPSLLLLGRILAAHGIECWLLGIQPARGTTGATLHPAVAASVDEAAAAIAAVLAREVCRG